MKVLVLDSVLDHEVLVSVLNIWSWSWTRSWRKSLAVFQDFCCNSWRQWARHTMAFCERQQKQFAIRKPLFERTFCAPCTSASVERIFNNGGYLLGHTDASKAQCVDCGKLISLDSNKPGFTGWNVIYKNATNLLRKVESRQGPPAKKAKLDEVLAAHCRADLVTECMKKKKH